MPSKASKVSGKRKLAATKAAPKAKAGAKGKISAKLSEKAARKQKVETVEQPIAKSKGKKAKAPAKAASDSKRLSLEQLKSIVDPQFINKALFHVYDDGKKVYHASLMWTDLKNNNNKFYIIQILQHNLMPSIFQVFNRWGRVGVPGQFAIFPFPSDKTAISCYDKKYKEKTGKGYTEIELAFEEENGKEEVAKPDKKKKKTDSADNTSKLDPRVQKLVNLIFNMKLMTDIMQKRGFDTKKLPLGKLSKATLQKGHDILMEIEAILDGTKKGDLYKLSGEFYTWIPHDFGFKQMSQFVINDKVKLKEKLETLESLGDLEIANSMLSKGGCEVDSNYSKLSADIEPIEKGSKEYEMVEKYFKNTGDGHKLILEELYKIDRKGEDKRFKKSVGNSFLLWHGSPITNMASILSGGLKVRCSEVPWLSDRIFHADMIAKSIGYTGYYSSNNMAMALLDRVALGKKIRYCDGGCNVWSPIPKGHTSIVLPGGHAPPEKSYIDHKGMTIPIGKAEQIPGVLFELCC